MRLLGSIAAVLLLSACNGGAQPPDSPQTTGNAPAETAPSGSTTAVPPNEPAPTTTVVIPMPENTTGTPMPTVSATSNPEPAAPTQPGGSCGGRTCGAGESCASYYGVAGPRGPMFHACVVRCRRGEPNDGCPQGKKCYTVADGPGDVCQ
ncbi:hypothetical protein [Polyangium sp. 6x1]|uniref:hypothetical protein n=1 Tax=Polyangium sp. 6x1 TaxID=3042689 RepID=UPI0024829A4F|nr:hypothetical protein [Polyangium sp. 6x1]MDI1444960.1 hypothetical protein [Polyangium sp. 6x1]